MNVRTMAVSIVAGMLFGMLPRERPSATTDQTPTSGSRLPWYFFAAALLLTLIVLSFYLTNEERNYGGWTAGLRWLMWLTPVWLLCLLPALDRLAASRPGRWFAYLLLGLSVLSASFPAWNPWRHPWIYRWMETQGWLPY